MRAKLLRILSIAILLASMLLMLVPFEALAQETVDDLAGSVQQGPLYRRSFYAEGRYWEFYAKTISTQYHTVFKSSTDGGNWTSYTNIAGDSASYYEYLDIAFDGTYIHVARLRSGNTDTIYYDRGNPNPDGTITWSNGITTPNWQIVVSVVSPANCLNLSICLDGNGYPYLATEYISGGSGANHYYTVFKSSTKDGTYTNEWTTNIEGPTASSYVGRIVGLTGGEIVAFYQIGASVLYARLYTGSSWGAVKSSDSALVSGGSFSAVGQGDFVHITALRATTYELIYMMYDPSLYDPFTTDTILSPSVWIVPPGITSVSVTAVGGGGGGSNGGNFGGGGGGGQIVNDVLLTPLVPGTSIAVVVGAGGGPQTAGENSSFSNVTALGGQGSVGLNGGTSGSGKAGGTGSNTPTVGGGGGGGNSAVGGNPAGVAGGAGGAGTFWSTSTYGGGGGGGGTSSGGAGGSGGGGAGGRNLDGYRNGASGTANTGGGGGGAVNATGGTGGSGVIILQYGGGTIETLKASSSLTSTSFPAISMDSANNIHVFWENDPIDDHIFYAKYVYDASTWVSYYDLIDEIDDLPATGYYFNTDYTCDESRVGIHYLADTTILKFKLLSEVFEVNTLDASAITPTTATLNGEIISLGFGSADSRGFYTNTTPSLVGATQHNDPGGPFNVGLFSHGVTGLISGVNYFYIAYATNDWGTRYGLWVQLSGGGGTGFVVTTEIPTNISSDGATFNANVLNVGSGITWHGFEYGKTVATMIPWTEASGNVTGTYSHAVIGLDEDQLYYVRAMIGNATATSYGEYVGFFTTWTAAEVPAKAYMDITVTGNCTSDYDYVSLYTTDVVHTALVNAGYINGNATDTELTVFMNGIIPYLPVSDRLAFMLTDFANNEVRTLRYYLGTTALQTDFYMTVGFDGNMTTADQDALEPGNTWQIDVAGYLDMSSGNASNWNKYIYYKQDAVSLYIGGVGNLTATIGNDTAPDRTISVAGIASGSHILQVDSNALDFRLYVDGTLMASTPTSSVGNNTTPWYFMGNNSMVAMDYFKLTVVGTEVLWYQPTALITGTTVVDRDDTGNGTINWGTNPACITITIGGILSNSIPPAGGGGNGTMWTAPPIDVSGWFGGCANVDDQPFYATFLSAATEMGMPVCSLYLMVMLGCAAAIGLGTLVFTGSIMISVIATSVAMLAAANTSVVPVYILFVFALMAVSIVYLSRQT